MLTKTKIALAVALVVGSASVALAENEDGNLRNQPVAATQAFHGRDVGLDISQGHVNGSEWYIDRQSQAWGTN